MRGKRIEKEDLLGAINSILKEEKAIFVSFRRKDQKFNLEMSRNEFTDLWLINPVFSVNSAIYLRRVFSQETRLIFIFRPCETRAFVELSKLMQLERNSFISGSVDCFGTFSSKMNSLSFPREMKDLLEFLSQSQDIRYSCKVCRNREGIYGDFGIRVDRDLNLWFVPYTDKALKIYERLSSREEDLPPYMITGPKFSDAKFSSSLSEFRRDFEGCIMCLNCRDMCPVCYCVDCLFNQDLYFPKGDSLINKIFSERGSMLPYGIETYHFIRMYHVSLTCSGCGACEEACPKNINLARYFIGVSERICRIFDYIPGRSFDEKIPFTTFREDEFQDAED